MNRLLKLVSGALMLLLVSCNQSFYNNVNDMGGQPATLYLHNGTIVNGKVAIRSFDAFSSVQKITFSEGNTNRYQEYYPLDIKGIYFNGAKYSLEQIEAMDMWNKRAYRFLKNITPITGKLELFEEEYQQKNAFGTIENVTKLYIKLPSSTVVYDAQSEHFVPNFNEKVSRYLSNCPTVATRILNKEKEFTYAFVNQGESQRKQVWMNIVFDYNQCKNETK